MVWIISFVAAIVIFFLFWRKRKAAFSENTVEADAIVLNVFLTGTCVKTDIQAVIQLQVQPERGKSFVTEAREMLSIPDYMHVQPGSRVRIRYCSRNRKEIEILRNSFESKDESREPATLPVGRQARNRV